MQRMKPNVTNQSGTLFIVGTPIGNLNDMTFRAVETLNNCAMILAEDTRNTRKLCTHFSIKTPLESYHQHNEEIKIDYIVEKLESGNNIALVSDAGMPVISDPGAVIVAHLRKLEIPITVVPGPSASISALAISGVLSQHHYFHGFLPLKQAKKVEVLKNAAEILKHTPVVLYESVHRLKSTLETIAEALNNPQVIIVRELTKIHEEWLRGTALELSEVAAELKGEFVIIIDRFVEVEDEESVEELFLKYSAINDLKQMEIVKKIAVQKKMKKNEVYKIVETLKSEKHEN